MTAKINEFLKLFSLCKSYTKSPKIDSFVLRPESANFRAAALNETWPSLAGSTKK